MPALWSQTHFWMKTNSILSYWCGCEPCSLHSVSLGAVPAEGGESTNSGLYGVWWGWVRRPRRAFSTVSARKPKLRKYRHPRSRPWQKLWAHVQISSIIYAFLLYVCPQSKITWSGSILPTKSSLTRNHQNGNNDNEPFLRRYWENINKQTRKRNCARFTALPLPSPPAGIEGGRRLTEEKRIRPRYDTERARHALSTRYHAETSPTESFFF